MSIEEQQKLKGKYYSNAMRYIDNARECLTKAQKEDGYYNDPKYVRMACGTAYSGVLIALDCFLLLKGIEKPKGKARKSIEYYHDNLGRIDRKMLNNLDSVYNILHLSGYYDGIRNAKVIKEGFDNACTIIEKIKPAEK
jgi:uncharacterized protein (UPF0332 family)